MIEVQRITVSPYLQWEHYQTTKGTAFEGANLFSVEVNSTVKIASRLMLVSNTSLKHDDGIAGAKNGLLVKNYS